VWMSAASMASHIDTEGKKHCTGVRMRVVPVSCACNKGETTGNGAIIRAKLHRRLGIFSASSLWNGCKVFDKQHCKHQIVTCSSTTLQAPASNAMETQNKNIFFFNCRLYTLVGKLDRDWTWTKPESALEEPIVHCNAAVGTPMQQC
jgi:hypothetical protein